MRIIYLIVFMSLCSTVFGADFITYDKDTYVDRVYESVDGARAGLCEANDNDNTIGNTIHATDNEVALAKTPYVKVDIKGLLGERVISMTQAEINAVILEKETAEKELKEIAIDNLDISSKEVLQTIINMGVVDETTFKTQLKSDSDITP